MSDTTYSYDDNSYVSDLLSDVKITDRNIIASATNFLNVYIDSCKANPNYYSEDAETYPVKIKMKNGSVIYRNVPFTLPSLQNIYKYAMDDTSFQKSIDTLPPYSDVTVDINAYYHTNFTSKDYKDAYKTLCEEYKAPIPKVKTELPLAMECAVMKSPKTNWI